LNISIAEMQQASKMKDRFTEEQIIKAITRLRHGMRPADLFREIGVTSTTLYARKKKHSNMTASDAKR
jgi:hypothetical protein